ncbi:MAG: lasso peptide biosynthesis B2 protein [Planctomycetota bacterium]|nr:lasso peptide biosynthesis B2 protein [Planctomycetota bacterium]
MHNPSDRHAVRVELPLCLHAWLVGLWVRLALWFLPPSSFMRMLEQECRVRHAGPRGPVATREQLCAAVLFAARFIPGSSCLTRAYTGRLLMARYAIPALVHVGVRKVEGRMESHAWLEADGHICLGNIEIQSYTKLF